MPGGDSSFFRALVSIVLEPKRKEKCLLRTLPFKSGWLRYPGIGILWCDLDDNKDKIVFFN